MRQKTSHTGDPATSSRLRLAVEINKDAGGPLTGMEMQDESRARGGFLANPSTCMYEIGKAPGYEVSDGQSYGQKPGPAVKFPDGKYRYWLISAPGWAQSWTVNAEFQVVPYRPNADCRSSPPRASASPLETALEDKPRTCITCGKPIDDDGPPFCKNDGLCKNIHLGIGAP